MYVVGACGEGAPPEGFPKELLEKHPKARFIYVSCEVETLARDLKELTQSGFALRQIEPFDMFPRKA